MAIPNNKQFIPVPLDAEETNANNFFKRNYAKTDDLKFIASLTLANSPAGLIEYLNSMNSILCEHVGVSSFLEHFTGYRCEFMTTSHHDLYELTDSDRYTPTRDKRSGHLKVMERVVVKSVMTVQDVQKYVTCISQITLSFKAAQKSSSSNPVVVNAATATVIHNKDISRDHAGSGVADDVRAALAAANSAQQKMDTVPTLESDIDTKYRSAHAPASVATLFNQDNNPVAMAAKAAAAAAIAGRSPMTGISLNEHHKVATSSIASFSALVQPPTMQAKPEPGSRPTSEASQTRVVTVASSWRTRHNDDDTQLASVMVAFNRLKVETEKKSKARTTTNIAHRAYLNYEVRESKQVYREVMANYEGPFPHDADAAHDPVASLYCHVRAGVSAKAHEVRPTTGDVPVFVHRKRNGTCVPFVLFGDFQAMLNGASVSQSANGKIDVTAIGTCYHARVNAGGRFQAVVALLPQALGLLKNGDLENQYQEQLYCILSGQNRNIDGAPMHDTSSLRSD